MVKERKDQFNKNIASKKKLIALTSLGVMFVLLPAAAILGDPIFIVAKHKLKLTRGSNIHKLLLSEMEAARLHIYLFNITNGPEFQSGKERKLKVDAVGPFTYQEYRSNKDLEFESEAAVVRFTPRIRTVFLPEESIGQPEDSILNMPNTPFLATTALLSPYSFIVHNIFNIMMGQLRPKSIMKISAQEFMWGYHNSVMQTVQSLVPGLVYYNSTGLLERLYDEKAEYRLVMGTADVDKFKVKSVYKYIRNGIFNNTEEYHDKLELNDTYEGAAFPSEMTPEMPLSIYRLGIWKQFHMQYVGKRQMEFGSEAFVYDLDNKTFDNKNLCDSKGFCPGGMLDISDSFFGLPIALSKAQLVDSDPRVLDRLEGLDPDREKYSSYILVEPKIGVTIGTSLLIQVNLILNDLSYNQEAAVYSDMVIPIAYCNVTFPELPSEAKSSLSLMYSTGPRIVLASGTASCLVGLALLGYSARLVWRQWRRRGCHSSVHTNPAAIQIVSPHSPLIQKLNI